MTAAPWSELGGGYCSAAHQQEKPHPNRSSRGGRRHHLSLPWNLPAPARCLAGVGLDSARPTLARRPYTLNRGRRWGMTPLAPYRYRTRRGRVQEGERPRAFSKAAASGRTGGRRTPPSGSTINRYELSSSEAAMESALPRTGAALAIMAVMAARINPPAAGSSHNNTGRPEWRGVGCCGPPRFPWG